MSFKANHFTCKNQCHRAITNNMCFDVHFNKFVSLLNVSLLCFVYVGARPSINMSVYI